MREIERQFPRYSAVAIVLHWLIAVLIFANLWLGGTMVGQHGLAKFNNFQLHKSVGITILLLSLARLAWRAAKPPPPGARGMAEWERRLSSAVHAAFYVLMIGMPLTGWLSVSASPTGIPTLLYRLGGFPGIPWPHLPIAPDLPFDQKQALEAAANTVHRLASYCAYALIGLHVAGALKHQLFDADPVLPRMAPCLRRRAVQS
jgi:cytochrome b561